jgi:primosomal protein N' (replication factor Y)
MQHLKGILICGSATPRVETYYRSKTGQTRLLHLSKRATGCFLPKTRIVDLREELANGNKSIFSGALRQNMNEALARNEQVILFINRRGYSGFYLCRDCGYVPKCESCSVSLTYHLTNKAMICHYCGKMYPLPKACPSCKSGRIGGFGAGTQKIEEICRNEFPDARILRMDQDTTTGRGSHARILEQFEKGEANVLIGTQMIAKGHDFPNVTVVGILSADLILGMPDFRASERTFQLITQAAGRAGRGIKEGNVIIQAYNVDEYSIVHAAAQDYEGFYEQEIAFRKAMGYPPFGAIGIIIVSSEYESAAYNSARKIRTELSEYAKDELDSHKDNSKLQSGECENPTGNRVFLQDNSHVPLPNCDLQQEAPKLEIMEISKAPIHKIRNHYRYRIVLKAGSEEHLSTYFTRAQAIQHEKGVMISFDINPYQMF